MAALGVSLTRRQLRGVFHVDNGMRQRRQAYPGATHEEIASVIEGETGFSAGGWFKCCPFDVRQIARAATASAGRASRPTIITFGISDPKSRARARHAAVLVSADPKMLHLLDPLGGVPLPGNNVNVSLFGFNRKRPAISVNGAGYRVLRSVSAYVLMWNWRSI
jgi:hypothetical protein